VIRGFTEFEAKELNRFEKLEENGLRKLYRRLINAWEFEISLLNGYYNCKM